MSLLLDGFDLTRNSLSRISTNRVTERYGGEVERSSSLMDQVSLMITTSYSSSIDPSIGHSRKPRMVFGMPVYNQQQENKLEMAVDSILAQTWKDFCLVIVDDASTDGTWDLVQNISQQDSRIRVFRNKERLGSIRNFRRVFELSQPSDFFSWASQHDWYEPDWLKENDRCLASRSSS